MKWALATVSFRYHLYALDAIEQMARSCGFQGIELWEPHYIRHQAELMRRIHGGSATTMLPFGVLSGYLDTTDFSQNDAKWRSALQVKLDSCYALGIPTLRLFTGTKSSAEATPRDWVQFFERIAQMNELAAQAGTTIVLETHPNTLLDAPSAVDRLVAMIRREGWSRIGINFDVFHVWEFGDGAVAQRLADWYDVVKHVHLKNAVRPTRDFDMHNVYHPMGRLQDSDSISTGVVELAPLLQLLQDRGYSGYATLEWFGEVSETFFLHELDKLNRMILVAKE
ncbi:3-dehydroshikimate dehydratase [Paenibacillus cellulosilyticus]|uniref:3-dehydroshikimate dehydratase n=1 Tax=Paenibacillus cellulosilyticus TaxID=375489 RepID=A0A2V2Z0I7_9BACL|nr:sugar phosphate isomerase/epimerase family protein [Paenibacillus cellulosilyticus]PWW06545.1 3-dehydroshikimate dehydratase [Paenibacillus cellulosilyticus]QKS46119.1 sugar phosphate isomerase/epimerase [Paenibacillus cellulosilyticus]